MIINDRFNMRNLLLTAALIVGFVNHTSAQEIGPYFIDLNSGVVRELGSLYGVDASALGINDSGQVAGAFVVPAGPTGTHDRAFITGPDGVGMRDIGTLGGIGGAFAAGINNAGQVVGSSGDAFITGPNGEGMRSLGTLSGQYAQANGINNAGQVVGYSSTPEGHSHAFITGPNGEGMRSLGTLGGQYTEANGINDAGQVAGYSEPHAFITGPNGEGMRALGPLGRNFSYASAINNTGEVVGRFAVTESPTGAGPEHAFITAPNGGDMRDLGTLGGDENSVAYGINDAGQVVGYSSTAEGRAHAFITGANGIGMMDLNSLVSLPKGVVLTSAMGINNNGQVIAQAAVIPVIPEPETYALMLAGLSLIGVAARCKKSEDGFSIHQRFQAIASLLAVWSSFLTCNRQQTGEGKIFASQAVKKLASHLSWKKA